MGGDLNLIRNIEEKMGGKYFSDPSRVALEEIIEAHKLIDIPPCNGKFTWSNKRVGTHNIKERLDRILIHESIAAEFSSIKSKIVHATASDHKPVVLKLERIENFGPIPFKYNRNWDSKEDFKKEKESQQISEEEQVQEKDIFTELYWQNIIEEEELRQKSRCLWLKAGDKNTSFFHNDLKLRRAGNQIDKILVEGKELTEQEEIKEAAHNHFKSLLTANVQPMDSVDFLLSVDCKISGQQNNDLEKQVSEEEVREATWSMQPDKAPGPYGFTISFYRAHWDIIKKDLIRMVKNVFKKIKMGENTKSSHLALIRKESNPLSFDRYRPISLCNVSYKIVTKILANRLKKLLPTLISENQGGFVPKRQIMDNVILVQEAIHSSLQRKEKGMVIKLDMENAFDRVSHQFLMVVLQKFGISNKFINIIMECISNPWIAPLINGRPSSYFRSSRGLRQGCPLSPFLFIIMAETLSIHLENQRKKGEITGISIARGIK
eukprot:PITA_09681